MSLFSNIVFLIFISSLKTLYIGFCSYLPASSISSQIHPHCPSHPTLSLLLCNPSTPICGAHIFIDMWPSNGACSACQELHSKESRLSLSQQLPVASSFSAKGGLHAHLHWTWWDFFSELISLRSCAHCHNYYEFTCATSLFFFIFACLFLRLDPPLSTWLASKFRHTENCLSLVLGLKLWATIPGLILIFKIVPCRYFICSAGRARASEIFLILYMLYGICIFLTCVSTILDIGNYLC